MGVKRYNHAFTLAFSLETDNEGDKVTEEELLQAIKKRIRDLEKVEGEIIEACGLPFDTYENPEYPNSAKFIEDK